MLKNSLIFLRNIFISVLIIVGCGYVVQKLVDQNQLTLSPLPSFLLASAIIAIATLVALNLATKISYWYAPGISLGVYLYLYVTTIQGSSNVTPIKLVLLSVIAIVAFATPPTGIIFLLRKFKKKALFTKNTLINRLATAFTLISIIFFFLPKLWFNLTTLAYPPYYKITSGPDVRLEPNSVIFQRIQTSLNSDHTRSGIYIASPDQYVEKKLFTFKDLGSERIGLITSVVSPDQTKLAFYVSAGSQEPSNQESKYHKQTLFVYDLKKNKLSALLKDVYTYRGYTQNPVWDEKSQTMLVSFKKDGVNTLHRINLFGVLEKVGLNYSGNAFWPRYLDRNTIVFNTAMPQNGSEQELTKLGFLDLRFDWIKIIDLGFSTYASTFDIARLNHHSYLRAGGYNDQQKFSETDIHNLIDYNEQTGQINTIPIPTTYNKPSNLKRLSVQSICDNIAYLIEHTTDPRDKAHNWGTGRHFIYFLNDKSLAALEDTDFDFFPTCQRDQNRIYMLSSNKLYDFNLQDPLHPTVFDFNTPLKKIIGDYKKHNLYINLVKYEGRRLYLSLEPGWGNNQQSFLQGLYLIDFDRQAAHQISQPPESNIQDIYLMTTNQ